jgi:hypothetical protein
VVLAGSANNLCFSVTQCQGAGVPQCQSTVTQFRECVTHCQGAADPVSGAADPVYGQGAADPVSRCG